MQLTPEPSLITRILPFVVAVATGGRVAAVVSAVFAPEPPASASVPAASSVDLAADEDAWRLAASAAPQTVYVQEGLAGLACIGGRQYKVVWCVVGKNW